MRETKIENKYQLSLGELIEKLESFNLIRTFGEKEEKEVIFDFGTATPKRLSSWRGSYRELELEYELSGYDNHEKHFNRTKATELLEELKSGIGKTFEGWKGGDFTMDKDTPVWVSNPGNASNTVIFDIIDDEVNIILLTAYCEY